MLRRTGHTEATIDLARMAGFYPAGVLVEILNEDGSMARLPQLYQIAQKHNLKIIAIKDLVAYRMRTERLIEKEVSTTIETTIGAFDVVAYRQMTTGDVHLAIRKGSWDDLESVLVRVHSSTEAGEILGTLFKDYGGKLKEALKRIAKEEKGLLLYMRHGENKDAILQKLKALSKKDKN